MNSFSPFYRMELKFLFQNRDISDTPPKNIAESMICYLRKKQQKGTFGDAIVRVCDTVKMTEILYPLLKENRIYFLKKNRHAEKVCFFSPHAFIAHHQNTLKDRSIHFIYVLFFFLHRHPYLTVNIISRVIKLYI